VTNTWVTLTTSGMFTPRQLLSSSVLDGKIYVIGGQSQGEEWTNTVEVFDPATNSWSTPVTGGTFTARRSLAAITVNGKIYALGGYDGKYLNTNEVFTPITNGVNEKQFSTLTIFPNPTTGILSINNIPENLSKISIINMLGETVLEMNNPRTGNARIDLSKFPVGIYYARCISPESVSVRKIIRE